MSKITVYLFIARTGAVTLEWSINLPRANQSELYPSGRFNLLSYEL